MTNFKIVVLKNFCNLFLIFIRAFWSLKTWIMSSKDMTDATFSKHAYEIVQLTLFWFLFENAVNQCHDQTRCTKKCQRLFVILRIMLSKSNYKFNSMWTCISVWINLYLIINIINRTKKITSEIVKNNAFIACKFLHFFVNQTNLCIQIINKWCQKNHSQFSKNLCFKKSWKQTDTQTEEVNS